MFRKNTQKVEKKALLERAYKLGFEVGYYKHYESVGWVKKEMEKIIEEAKRLKIIEEIKKAYERGKIDGKKKKSIDMLSGETIVSEKENIQTAGLTAIKRVHYKPRFISFPKFLKRHYHR